MPVEPTEHVPLKYRIKKFLCIAIPLISLTALLTNKSVVDHIKLMVGLILASISVITLNMWAAIITILYGLMQIGLLIPGYVQMWKNHKNGNKP